eukprot:scaffold24501_cov78-Skeletonema_dohrnii-CCMP3373.AAC.1
MALQLDVHVVHGEAFLQKLNCIESVAACEHSAVKGIVLANDLRREQGQASMSERPRCFIQRSVVVTVPFTI